MESTRPLDALNASRGKRAIIELKNGMKYVGKLEAFDIHVNVVIKDCEEIENDQVKRKLGTIFIRGDTIVLIAPQE